MKCDRCQKDGSALTMSLFNTDMICLTCQSIERTHPDFEKAYEAEQDAISRGEFNFPGIGLPDDLK